MGNPIQPGLASKSQVEPDYVGSGSTPLTFVRTYSSTGILADKIGPQWRHTFSRVVEHRPDLNPPIADVSRPDGAVLRFILQGATWVPDADITDRLVGFTGSSGQITGWEFTSAADDSLEAFDGIGQLISITYRNGVTQRLTYHGNGAGKQPANAPNCATIAGAPAPANNRLWCVTDSFGRQLHFAYDSSGRIGKLFDAAAGQYTYAYTSSEHLASVTYPDGKVRTYHYNESAHTGGAHLPYALTGITDENSVRFATFKYDNTGRAISTERAGGAGKVSLTYGTGSATVTDALNTARLYSFQQILGVPRNASVSQACPGCALATTYDANANVASRKDFNNNLTCFAYDLARNLETVRGEGLTAASCPANLTSWTPAGGTVQRKITTEWHPTWRLPTKICEPTRITTLAYDAKGNLTSRAVQATNNTSGASGCSATPVGTARTTTYTYTYGSTNPAVPTQIVVDGPRTDLTDTTTYVFEEATGNLLSMTNALGHVTTLGDYDAHGKPGFITDPNGLTTSLDYDARQRLASRSVGSETTGYTYDNAGQLTRVTLPDSSYIEYVYDAAHRLTEIRDNLGNKSTYTLDLMGNRTAEETRDPAGVLKAKRTREYNALNRLLKDIGGTNPTTQIIQYGYDLQGNLTSTDGPLTGTPNDLTQLAYDPLNRLKQVTDALSGLTRYTYDGVDQLASVQDPRNNSTVYTTSGLGDETREVSPDRGTTNATFDAAGNQLTRRDARSKTTTYAYDALNRVTSMTFQGGTSVGLAYDQGTNGKGHLTTVTWPGGQTTYTYNLRGRVTQKSDAHSGGITRTVGYAWDSTTGRLTSMTYPSGRVLTLGYDGAGRMASLQVGTDTIALSIAYFPFGSPAGWTWGNAQSVSRSFDLDGRLTGLTLGAGATRSVIYDEASRISALNDPNNALLNQSLAYDRLDRLTSWSQNTSSRSYGYDANGNRSSLTIGGNTYGYLTAATTNRLGSTSGPLPARSFTYDAAGNTTGDGQTTWVYNNRGRLASATKGGNTVTYTHDGLGQRVKKAGPASLVPTGTNYFAYDEAGRLLGEYDNVGAAIAEYVYLGELPVAVLKGPAAATVRYYIHTDQVGRPWTITNGANQLVWRWDTSPFGELPADENPSGLGAFSFNLRFPGQYADAETGLFYNYFRDYDPQTGRYVQSDPIGLTGGINTYLYADANPLDTIDPDGLNPTALARSFSVGWRAGEAVNPWVQPALARAIDAVFLKDTSNVTDWDEVQKDLDHESYHRACDRPPPPGLDPCQEARWRYRQALKCQRLRDAWEQRWGSSQTIAKHREALLQVKARLRNAAEDIARFCGPPLVCKP